MSLLEIDNLIVQRAGKTTLSLSHLSLEAGEVLGVMGPSGSGKSTAARALLGLGDGDEATTGRIRFDGRDILGATASLRGTAIGLISQDPLQAFNPLITVGAHVVEGLRWHTNLSSPAAWTAAQAAFARVGLPSDLAFLRRFPHQLSGGQRQRVAIAAAMSVKPHLLIADEPTSALDVIAQDHISQLLRSLAREDGVGLIFISHDLGLLARVTDRLIVLSDGEIVESGATQTIVAAPQHAITRSLLRAAQGRAVPEAGPVTGPIVLEARQVERHYGHVVAVDGISFTLRRGQGLGIIGESGSGKSTLTRTLLALEAAQHGVVCLAGEPFSPHHHPRDLRHLRKRIQAVFQDPSASFNPLWTVSRIVAEPLHVLGETFSAAEVRDRVADALTAVGLSPDIAERLPHRFSGGQQQKIALARALILKPDILVLDEAVSALDTVSRQQIIDLLSELKRRDNLSLVFVSHDLSAVQALVDHVLIMKDGRQVEYAPTATIFTEPRADYTRALLDASPIL